MSQGKRPGGLTALAVINFVWAGFGCLGLLAVMGSIAIIKAAHTAASEATTSGQVAELPSLGGLYLYILLYVVVVALLIISGIGYLGLKKTMGFKMGNLYAIISIVSSIIGIIAASQGFNIMSIIGFIYPAVTLFLLNTTFKEDFVN